MDTATPERPTLALDWQSFGGLLERLVTEVTRFEKPEAIIAIERGGLIPAVHLAHNLQIADFYTISARRTVSDEMFATKHEPRVVPRFDVGKIKNKDVLVVDDIAGTGDTLRSVCELLVKAAPKRLRTLVCFVNHLNWTPKNQDGPKHSITYVGSEVSAWVVFPWENRGG